MTQQFELDESLLPVLARYYPVATNLDAAAAIEAAIQGGYPDLSPAITAPGDMKLAVDRLADSEGAVEGYRVLVRISRDLRTPWLAPAAVEDVIDRQPLRPDGGDNESDEESRYDTAKIIRDAVEAANELLDWHEQAAGTGSTAAWFTEARAMGCTATGFSSRDDTLTHDGAPPCPLHEQGQ